MRAPKAKQPQICGLPGRVWESRDVVVVRDSGSTKYVQRGDLNMLTAVKAVELAIAVLRDGNENSDRRRLAHSFLEDIMRPMVQP